MTFTKRQGKTVESLKSQSPAQDGSPFEAIFQQNWERVCRVVYRLVGDWAEAEDLALEAFVRLYHRPPQDESRLTGWLYRVATNLGFNAMRARKRRRRYEEEAGYEVVNQEPNWDPAAVIEQAQERQRVREVLEQMKPRSAQILVLRHAGLPYAEIAAAAGVAPGSVGTLLARAEREFVELYRQPADPPSRRE